MNMKEYQQFLGLLVTVEELTKRCEALEKEVYGQRQAIGGDTSGAKALKYYAGEPFGNEQAGRSQ